MTTKDIGLRDARDEIGDLANLAHLTGEITYLTRNRQRIAAIVPLTRITETPELTFAIPADENAKWSAIAVLNVMRRLSDGIVGMSHSIGAITVEEIAEQVTAELHRLTDDDGEVADGVAEAAGELFRLLDQAINQAR